MIQSYTFIIIKKAENETHYHIFQDQTIICSLTKIVNTMPYTRNVTRGFEPEGIYTACLCF